MKISLSKLTISILLILLALSTSFIYLKTINNEEFKLSHRIESNQNKFEGHLKFITSLHNARKVVRRVLKNRDSFEEVRHFLISMEKNSNTVKNYLSIDGQVYEPELPYFLSTSNLLQDDSSNVRTVIFDGENFHLINKIKEEDCQIISTYNINYDDKLKSRISETEFSGYYLDVNENYYFWSKEDKPTDEIFTILNDYKMSFKDKTIMVENSTGIPGLYFTISDSFNSQNALKSFSKNLLFLLLSFLIITSLFILLFSINKKIVKDIENMVIKGEPLKKKRIQFNEYSDIIDKVENIYKSNIELNEDIISKNKKLKKLEGLSKNKMNFLAQISHEIRTPMNCIIGFSEMIISENEPKNNKIFANKIIEESETLLKLINDILDDSKIESGKMVLECNRVNLEEFFTRMMDLGNSYDTNNLIDIEYYIDSSLPHYIGIDELRFYQVVSNIYFNALKYTPIGNIKINVIKGFGNKISISIVDTGIGIPMDKLPTIFNDYERVTGKLNTGFRGTGLGLSITKKILELMNGSITVESEQGTGSSFTIVLPYTDVSQSVDKNIKKQWPNNIIKLHGEVLLAEDYPTNRIIAKRHLESAGLKVTMAENGKEAIEISNEKKFDIILMDIQMPIIDGFTATKEIRESSDYNKDTPIVAMTANGLKSVEDRSKQFSMNGVILKPIKKISFLNAVANYLNISVPVN